MIIINVYFICYKVREACFLRYTYQLFWMLLIQCSVLKLTLKLYFLDFYYFKNPILVVLLQQLL